MNLLLKGRMLGLTAALFSLPTLVQAVETQDLIQLLDTRQCQRCSLADADLMQADLRDARLEGARLTRANLSGARLDGADLRNVDLRDASLAGASLRGADLRGSLLLGADLRHADLSGALLNQGALSQSHWQQARGLNLQQHSYAELHNAGVSAAQAGRYPEAETFFNAAIRQQPEAAISWMARGIVRTEQGKQLLAAQDLAHAGQLYGAMGDQELAQVLERASRDLTKPDEPAQNGNGTGSALMAGAAKAIQLLAPLAMKALMPIGL